MNIFENQLSLYMPICRNFRLLNLPFRYWMFNVYDGHAPHVDTTNGTVGEIEEETANEYGSTM